MIIYSNCHDPSGENLFVDAGISIFPFPCHWFCVTIFHYSSLMTHKSLGSQCLERCWDPYPEIPSMSSIHEVHGRIPWKSLSFSTGGVESFEYLWLSKAMVWSHLCRGVWGWKSLFLLGKEGWMKMGGMPFLDECCIKKTRFTRFMIHCEGFFEIWE